MHKDFLIKIDDFILEEQKGFFFSCSLDVA